MNNHTYYLLAIIHSEKETLYVLRLVVQNFVGVFARPRPGPLGGPPPGLGFVFVMFLAFEVWRDYHCGADDTIESVGNHIFVNNKSCG